MLEITAGTYYELKDIFRRLFVLFSEEFALLKFTLCPKVPLLSDAHFLTLRTNLKCFRGQVCLSLSRVTSERDCPTA